MNKIIFSALIYFCFVACKNNQNEINKSKEQALKIAQRYDIYGDSVEINFETYIYPTTSIAYKKGKRKLIYWHIQKKCNNCGLMQVDAKSGNVFTVGKYNYVH